MGSELGDGVRARPPVARARHTEALRPSELFALRCKSFDDGDTLSITETVYRRKLRPYGKTPGSPTKIHLPEGLADELRQ